MSDSDDEPITLSGHALAALAEFKAEKHANEARFEELKTGIAAGSGADSGRVTAATDGQGPLSISSFAEDWNESQFWYSDESASLLAEQLLEGASASTTIGVLSTPSVFVALKNIVRKQPINDQPRLVLFEHDDRFNVFSEYIFYDYQQPLRLSGELKGTIDRVIIDPPFFNNDCQTKFALTARWLLKPSPSSPSIPRIVVCTGERMTEIVTKLYRLFDVRPTTFEPAHSGTLSNHYYCYSNFECPSWTWRLEAD
ncbi:putative N6-adenine methyltransferase-domain-containing protein [Dactylonectria estremocensis]|uniref:Protein-lysine N-methyltransferase EFM5 n=1 Tax=Dactylonectria estremocensis TaxID=1079267 RepID=A0A9P9E279_9HYPO|nr:putative N6-adenine methyltransferase-domain-containing protein [Dactylonectria estremocensis]